MMMCVLGRRFFLGFGTISTPAEKKSTVFLAARNVLTVKLRDHTYSAVEEEDRGFPIEKQSPLRCIGEEEFFQKCVLLRKRP